MHKAPHCFEAGMVSGLWVAGKNFFFWTWDNFGKIGGLSIKIESRWLHSWVPVMLLNIFSVYISQLEQAQLAVCSPAGCRWIGGWKFCFWSPVLRASTVMWWECRLRLLIITEPTLTGGICPNRRRSAARVLRTRWADVAFLSIWFLYMTHTYTVSVAIFG